MDFRQLEYVIAVAEEKNFSNAAKRLYISQPSLSQYIMRLEEHLGIKLFDRSTNPLRLTPAGEKYVKTAEDILNLENQLKQEIADMKDEKKGHLVIGIPIPTERYILPLILPRFVRQFPGIEIAIKEDSAIHLEELLISGEVDIAILHLPIQDKRIEYEPLSFERIFLVAPPNHEICSKGLEAHRQLDISSFQNERFILLKPGHRMRFVADEIFQNACMKPNIFLEIKNLDTAYRLSCAGLGFTLIPENIIKLLNTNQLKNYFLMDGISFTLAIAYRKGEYLAAHTREFIRISKTIIDSNFNSSAFSNKFNCETCSYNSDL